MESLVPPAPTKIQAEIHVYEEIKHQNLPAEPTQETEMKSLVPPSPTKIQAEIQHLPLPLEPTQDSMQIQIMGDDFVDVNLHSNNSDNGNDLQENIYSQATGFWGCIRKWL
jgi:hypothetical protein